MNSTGSINSEDTIVVWTVNSNNVRQMKKKKKIDKINIFTRMYECEWRKYPVNNTFSHYLFCVQFCFVFRIEFSDERNVKTENRTETIQLRFISTICNILYLFQLNIQMILLSVLVLNASSYVLFFFSVVIFQWM